MPSLSLADEDAFKKSSNLKKVIQSDDPVQLHSFSAGERRDGSSDSNKKAGTVNLGMKS